MMYFYKESIKENIFGMISREVDIDSEVYSTQTTALEGDQQQEHISHPPHNSSPYDRGKEKLKITMQEKERVIMYLRSTLEAVS